MKKITTLLTLMIVLIIFFVVGKQGSFDVVNYWTECTMGVNHTSVTTHDGPMLWKVLDASTRDMDEAPEDICLTVKYYPAGNLGATLNSIVIVYAYEGLDPHKHITGGINEAGLGGGHTNANGGPFMGAELVSQSVLLYDLLGSTETIDQVRDFLQQGVGQGMHQEKANYGFIDHDGQATMFEIDAPRDTYREYDSIAPARQEQGLLGFVVRANEFHLTDDGMDDTTIKGRYLAGTENTLGLIDLSELDEVSAVQSDNADTFRLIRFSGRPPPISISNSDSYAALSIRGAAPGEDPALATMWALLGQPSFSIAVPTWVAVSNVPEPINNCDMYNAAMKIYNQKEIEEDWVQAAVFPAETHLFDMVNNRILPHWRSLGGPPDVAEMIRIEHQMAQDAFSVIAFMAETGQQNLAPTVDFEVILEGAFVPTTADPDGSVVSYLWNFGDGSTSTETEPVHDFPGPGVYLVSLTVADDDGVTTTAWRYLNVSAE